ncbi:myb/sant-like dna-binding domain [Holotrichia oblita]|uniref:Myb/sant-like dna-binding domain n=1 Tax=Holotrichia oblita TaxID=644536 RepID=A0ACB9SJN3_HOLOL|nr:myb/sant-like dna-binding domain [Holotrichia oblita]
MDEQGNVLILKDYIIVNNKLIPRRDHEHSSELATASVNEEEQGEGEDLEIEQENTDNTNFVWNEQSILFFLSEYEKEIQNFRNPKMKKKHVWNKIAERMIEGGCAVDAAVLDQKLSNMKSTFNKIKDNNKTSSTGRGRINWPYYERMNQIFQCDKTVHLPAVVSTLDVSPSTSQSKTPESLENTPQSQSKRNLDSFRKRQLEIEQERLEELKKVRQAIEVSNELAKEKIRLMEKYLGNK